MLMGLGKDQQQHPSVHTGGVIEGGGSVAVSVGVSDMQQVTGDPRHKKCDTQHVTHDN